MSTKELRCRMYTYIVNALRYHPSVLWSGVNIMAFCQPFQGSRQRGVTLVLSNLLKQWFPHKIEVHLLKEEGNKLAEDGNFHLAIEKYSKAIITGGLLVLLKIT